MNFLIHGDNPDFIDSQIDNIKNHYCKKATVDFNFHTLYADDIRSKKILEERLCQFPLNAKKRVLVVRKVEQLKSPIKDFLKSYLENPYKHVVLVLESSQTPDKKNAFFNAIAKNVKIAHDKKSFSFDNFDLFRAIEKSEPVRALKVLNFLLGKSKPVQVLAAMAGYFAKRPPARDKELKHYLEYMHDADKRIKTTSVDPKFVLERLVLRMCFIK
ncbi:MAG: hypothetical protein P9L96_00680 [Candidatus Gygaella obscura]|nr:hypothetical protein [Candidatus Gygaella obscura]